MRSQDSWAGVAIVAFLSACRKEVPAAGAPEGDASSGSVTVTEVKEDAEARAGNSPCAGGSLSLLGAAVDERCAISERQWKAAPRKTDGGGAALRQEARREGEQVVVSIVNVGTTPVVVPLRFHPGHPELGFTVLAEDEQHAVFELAPPSLTLPPASVVDGGPAFARVHSARITLPPGGRADARMIIDARVLKRLDRGCADAGLADAGACPPARLPKGRYRLYIGQLVTDLDTGPHARVEWDAL